MEIKMLTKKKKKKKYQTKNCGNGILVLGIYIFTITLKKICFGAR